VLDDRVVVGSVLVVVGPMLVVVGLELVGVGPAVVVVNSVVVGSVVVVETAVLVGGVALGSVVVLRVVTGVWPVAPGVACVLVSVGSLQRGPSAVVRRPVVVIGRLAGDGLISGLLVGEEDWVVDSWVVVVVTDVGAGAGLVVTVGRATPGARFGGGA
jgi:hypothetical protein